MTDTITDDLPEAMSETSTRTENLILTASDGKGLNLYQWLPEGEVAGTIQIAHGMGEHAARYEYVAGKLTGAGYAVYANDLRGHYATHAKAVLKEGRR